MPTLPITNNERKNSLSLFHFEQIGTDLNKLKRRKTLLNTGDNQKNTMK